MSTLLRRTLAVVALCALSRPGLIQAAELEGVTFAKRHEAVGATLDLRCVGLMRWMYVIKAYVAGLYVGQEVDPQGVLADVPKRLELNYFHPIPAHDFVKVTNVTIAANTDATTLARLQPQIEALNALYRDVEPGDRYAITYVPGRGTELALNGDALGTIPGAEFARAMFAIWLGAKPLDASLKAQLLSCS